MLSCKYLNKAFEGKQVLKQVCFEVEDNRIYCLMGPSGVGKTTLLRILLGLEAADSGEVAGISLGGFSAVFQENRLLEQFTPVQNLEAVSRGKFSKEQAIAHLSAVLPKECLTQPICEFSGGMKRRVSVVRAMLADSRAVIMDEPFTGLDEASREQTIAYIKREQRQRSLIISTHQEQDVPLLGAEVLKPWGEPFS